MKTLAVVIGNNNYYADAKLDNAINDAKGMADIFAKLGYTILFGQDTKIEDCTTILYEFEKQLPSYDASIFYFAGHGFQLDGENYLAAIDCQVASPNKHHCSKTCITLTDVLGILKNNSSKMNIVIIDACRKSFERGGNSSFTPIQAPKGTLIAFSTSPNEGAMDKGIEGHSIYTGSLLKYIGREWISVEELFKKVRKTVYNLTEGKQTTWEHTSLIGDFYFNTGQLIYSIEIPYDEAVVKDVNYKDKGDRFSKIILEIKSSNWDRQNPAIDEAITISAKKLDKNQLFILGRNLLQAGGYANSATAFFKNLSQELPRYFEAEENHLLNGILYEIYFNHNGEFRKDNLKKHCFEEIMTLRKDKQYSKSFGFIQGLLEPYRNMLYIPSDKDSIIDVDVLATSEQTKDFFNGEQTFEVISVIKVGSRDVIDDIRKYDLNRSNHLKLQSVLANYLNAPLEVVQINSNIELNNIAFTPAKDNAELEY